MTKETFLKAVQLEQKIKQENGVLQNMKDFHQRGLVIPQAYTLYDSGSARITVGKELALKVIASEIENQEAKIKSLEVEFESL